MSRVMISRAPSGHRAGASHPRARLTTEEVGKMRYLRERHGMTYAQLAERFGCGISTARDIVTYRTRIAG